MAKEKEAPIIKYDVSIYKDDVPLDGVVYSRRDELLNVVSTSIELACNVVGCEWRRPKPKNAGELREWRVQYGQHNLREHDASSAAALRFRHKIPVVEFDPEPPRRPSHYRRKSRKDNP